MSIWIGTDDTDTADEKDTPGRTGSHGLPATPRGYRTSTGRRVCLGCGVEQPSKEEDLIFEWRW